jgi:Na+/H+ antiporter NhaD/arsenite permease-like protein
MSDLSIEAHHSFTPEMWIAAAVLVAAYILVFSEVVHRTTAGVLGAVLMIAAGMTFGFYTQESAILAIEGNTLLLLLGMMLLVAMLRPTGGLEYVGIRLAKLAGGDPRKLLVYLCLATSVLSMVLDNVTTVLIFAPLTVLITRILDLNPVPYLIGEAMLSNIGGAATLVGDPPNIMIGSVSGLDFTAFLIHMGPMVVPAWIITILLLLFLFRKELKPGQAYTGIVDLDESRAIKQPGELLRILLSLAIVLGLFFVHHQLHLFPAYVAWIGVAIALLLLQPQPEKLFVDVEWSVLVFFAALFVIVGGVESSGLLDMVGQMLAEAAGDSNSMLWNGLLLMWVAAVLSALVDNIPFTVTMLPIVSGLESFGINVTPLWWALAIGVGLGGNMTHIGATANIICIAELDRSGHPESRVTPMKWMRAGIPVMLTSLGSASVVYIVLFEWFT